MTTPAEFIEDVGGWVQDGGGTPSGTAKTAVLGVTVGLVATSDGSPPPSGSTVTRLDLPFDTPSRDSMLTNSKKVWAHYFLSFPLAYTFSQDSPIAPDCDTRISATTGAYLDNTNAWKRINPPGEGSATDNNAAHSYGGDARDRPLLKRAKRTETVTTRTVDIPGGTTNIRIDFRVRDMIDEVHMAMQGGIDGWALDMLDIPISNSQYDMTTRSGSGTTGGAPLRWRQFVQMCQAIYMVNQAAGKVVFQILCMPDGSTGATPSPASLLVSAIEWTDATFPGIFYTRGGDLVLAPYQPEIAPNKANRGATTNTSITYWTAVINGLKADNVGVKFIPCYSGNWKTHQPDYFAATNSTQGVAIWGTRDPDDSASESNNTSGRGLGANIKNTYGNSQIFMPPVSIADSRPNQSNYYENRHFDQWINSWVTAIGDNTKDSSNRLLHVPADMVQLPTWSDFAEGAMVMPTDNNGWVPLDIGWYWMTKWKTGSFPTIKRDAIYLSHRIMKAAATHSADTNTYSSGQTQFMQKRSGTVALENSIGVLCFLTAAATVTINAAGTTYTISADAGMSVLPFKPLPTTGLISVAATRGGATIAAIASSEARKVRTSLVSDDVQYRYASSLEAVDKPAISAL